MLECTTEYKDKIRPAGRALTYDWSTNTFIIVVYQNFFKVQSEFSVQSMAKKLSHRQPC